MKRFLQILILKFKVSSLKREREKTLLDISMRNPSAASRVDSLENIRPQYFKDIDEKISSRERLINILSK